MIALDGRGVEGRTVEERTTRALVAAAAAERVAVLYSSLLHAEWQTGVPALDLKGRLELVARRSGTPATILRPGMLMDVFDDPGMRERATSDGVLASAIAVDAAVSTWPPTIWAARGALLLEYSSRRAGATLDPAVRRPHPSASSIPRLLGDDRSQRHLRAAPRD